MLIKSDYLLIEKANREIVYAITGPYIISVDVQTNVGDDYVYQMMIHYSMTVWNWVLDKKSFEFILKWVRHILSVFAPSSNVESCNRVYS